MYERVGSGYALVEATGAGGVVGFGVEFLPLPHLTLAL